MRLEHILKNCQAVAVAGEHDIEVLGLACDSRNVLPGFAFFALPGTVSDGHDFLDAAIARGAQVLFVEKEVDCPINRTVVQVTNGRLVMAQAAQVFYGDPTLDLLTIGVTGTNGKTTVTYLLEAILTHAGKSPAVLGTINYRYGNEKVAALHTTPESIDLMAQLARFREAGASSLVMEVSSHALDQFRADGVHYSVGVFTNLTPEHLDYHGEMEAYFNSKLRLFTELLPADGGKAVINTDDHYGRRLASMLDNPLTCGQDHAADVHFTNLDVTLHGIRGTVSTPVGVVTVTSSLLGDYNIENLLCAIAAAVAAGIDAEQISMGLAEVACVPGRLEAIANDRGAVVLVDYAHTGDALRRVLDAIEALGPRRIITVFGCGGDRDRSKRPVMAKVAASRSTIAIATSDNPRTEDPQRILDDVRSGLAQVHDCEWSQTEASVTEGRGYVVIPDRREAIQFAVGLLQPGDVLLVAGKGHEDYQILGTTRIHFDDREELRVALHSGERI